MSTTTEPGKNITAETPGLLEAAQGCRAANFTALQCAPVLYKTYPSTSANELASVLVEVWACELALSVFSASLNSCKKNDGSDAFSSSEISAAATSNMTFEFLNVANIPTSYGGGVNKQLKMIGLAHGDLVSAKSSEGARFLVISCLPGDYSPTGSSVIQSLQTTYGVDVAALAESPAADYRSTHHCWISNNLTSTTGTPVPYQQLLVFESSGQNAVANIPGVFSSIQEYVPSPPNIPNTGATIMSSMLSTGSAGANNIQVLDALFNGAYNLMTSGDGYNLTCFRLISYPPDWSEPLTTEFNSLKTQHGI